MQDYFFTIHHLSISMIPKGSKWFCISCTDIIHVHIPSVWKLSINSKVSSWQQEGKQRRTSLCSLWQHEPAVGDKTILKKSLTLGTHTLKAGNCKYREQQALPIQKTPSCLESLCAVVYSWYKHTYRHTHSHPSLALPIIAKINMKNNIKKLCIQ